uniref:glutamine amidotransferase-related protein n=1 Tax=Kineococcus sp. SYSU DK020 TaxID=3383141 RepID=UPI003D7D445B
MRVLLVDNHDSYTYNVFQLLAGLAGAEPVVVLNDAVAPAELDLAGFDAVVISPGPGHPGEARDFGLSAEVLARARVPVLGICLGHQGIALAGGGGGGGGGPPPPARRRPRLRPPPPPGGPRAPRD